ncbi:hypothetical protein LIER_20221 [Lithospermum erythrorhizon]|uniref:Uncharacterized protein n=1 Tax=Lithospermum erythrorhizon TaxID=34254 RepID=A0AAV3QKN9_LITER
MCTDFTITNKAFSKECYPLPNIVQLVDSSVGYKVVDILDAFRGYHQIFMAEEDVEKMTFVIIGKARGGDILQLYLAISEHGLSSVLIEEEDKV